MHDVFRLLHHLAFRDPQGGLGDRRGEVIDLNAVKLADGDFDGVRDRAEGDLAVLQKGEGLILQPAQTEIGFG